MARPWENLNEDRPDTAEERRLIAEAMAMHGEARLARMTPTDTLFPDDEAPDAPPDRSRHIRPGTIERFLREAGRHIHAREIVCGKMVYCTDRPVAEVLRELSPAQRAIAEVREFVRPVVEPVTVIARREKRRTLRRVRASGLRHIRSESSTSEREEVS